MDYIIPEYLKEDLINGDLSKIIESELLDYDFDNIPFFEISDFDEIMKKFKAFVCYKFLKFDSVIEQHVFIEVIKRFNSDITINPLIQQFIDINISSNMSDEELKTYHEELQKRYFSMIKNCMTEKFKDLSTKEGNTAILESVNNFITNTGCDISSTLLSTLTKCAIIESSRNSDLDIRFENFDEAVEYAYELHTEQLVTYEERLKQAKECRKMLDDIDRILEENNFDREL